MVTNITNVTKVLAKHLKQLSKAGLDAFIVAFCSLEAPRGTNPIQTKQLEEKTPLEIAETIVKSYTVRHGKAKVIQALRDTNENQVRVDLQKELRADGAKKKLNKAPNEAEAAPGTSGGELSAADQKPNVAASQQPNEVIPRKRGRKPKTESTPPEKAMVRVQTPAGTEGNKQAKKGKEPKGRKQSICAPGTSGGELSAADQRPNVAAGQQPIEVIPRKRGRKPKTESTTPEKSMVRVQTPAGAEGNKQAKKGKEPKGREQSICDANHFVIENRNNLIKLIIGVDPILDDLLEESLLTQEQYDIIRRKGTSQEKMRELFDYVRSWGSEDNDEFLAILKKHNPNVIRNLLDRSKLRK